MIEMVKFISVLLELLLFSLFGWEYVFGFYVMFIRFGWYPLHDWHLW